MNEKKFLVSLLVLVFLLFSIMGFMIFESHMQRNQVIILLEYEKLMGRYFNLFSSGELLDDHMKDQIPGFGFYNYYGEPLYVHGTALKEIDKVTNIPFFNKERESIIIMRDLMNPFIPIFRREEAVEAANREYMESVASKTPEFREGMIRFVYMEVINSGVYSMRRKYRAGQVLTTVFSLAIALFIWGLYMRNISYRKQIAAQEQLVLLGTAARTLSHEIKNPLSSIRLQSTIIKRSSCHLHDESLGIINEEVGRLSQMTEKIGDFLRHPEGEPQIWDLNGEVSRIMNRYGQNLSYSSGDELIPVLIDADRFRSILENILNNALQSGSPAEEILVELHSGVEQARLTVRDRGKGIPPENQEKLFDPFFTTKSTGSGIGLSIVQSFVHAAGGGIEIESETGRGTTVRVTFPLSSDKESLT